MRRAADLGDGDDESGGLYSPSIPEATDAAEESVDEIEFEEPIDNRDENLSVIKRNFLDRLAEVLAKFKTAKRAAKSANRNCDAKHVTSLMMVEDPSKKTARIFCAKNEGLDEDDDYFLHKLEQLYQNIVTNGKPTLSFSVIERGIFAMTYLS
ncbi:hypothetical protein ISF_00224 [Cordyceps fumosorosea ARSEF 2679]|uniref:Uncharacterized protein n=1 Tax=Cordyceps fumosorosea (strain ARSEF 2679) TaxID=1081104 RepID=A0A168E380_CORFA|nr:hypothetical protein ISF_00224 [Cordyceps fumosorosea ARSEF 2679]OAA73323.1 hypothetical protein ISF_00224 [Cordyceps fumosorosea ARSEF 2679]